MTEETVMQEQTRRRPNGENWTIDQFRDALDAAEAQLKSLRAPSIVRQGSFVQVTGMGVFKGVSTVVVEKRFCRRHGDCDVADAAINWAAGILGAKGLPGYAHHCHDDSCEECNGD